METVQFAFIGNLYSQNTDKLDGRYMRIRDGKADPTEVISFQKPIKQALVGMVYEWDYDAETGTYSNRRMMKLYPDAQMRAEWNAADHYARIQKTLKARAAKETDAFDDAVALLRPLYQSMTRDQRAVLMIRLQDELARK